MLEIFRPIGDSHQLILKKKNNFLRNNFFSFQIVKGERDQEEEETRRAQYLSANCVIFTYHPGDVSKQVDDHFNKVIINVKHFQCSDWMKC